jgi:hypothetical protein
MLCVMYAALCDCAEQLVFAPRHLTGQAVQHREHHHVQGQLAKQGLNTNGTTTDMSHGW